MRRVLLSLGILVCFAAGFSQAQSTQGSLYAVNQKGIDLGSCPLKTTSVKADISGFVTRVRVRQEFQNSFTEPIEAVYVFPLSQNGAVDDVTMTVGERVIRGKILKREEARQVYETAKNEGKTASLLDQERPNIFTQSVANIMPGEAVIVEISYVETLKYEDGAYEFVFPMTVGPRYIPSGVTDAAKITPPVAATRAGHDISIEVNLNAGVPVEEIRSFTHDIDQVNMSPSTAKITLRDEKTIPNKDFILRYDVTGKRIEDAVLTHRDERGGFFTLILQPPDKVLSEDRTPKEIVFVLDTSGSMSGFPVEKAKEAMKLSLDGLYPDDTFNLITFAGDTAILFDKPVPATRANLDAAQDFLAGRQGGGGTEMMKAIKAALEPTDAADHLRVVCFMTDGYVGNEEEIIAEVQRHPNARIFSFGIGSSVNRYLLDKIALEGRGEVEYVGLQDDGSKAARRFYERVRTPLLTDLSIDWNGIRVADTYPGKLTDLFSAKPVILHGRYDKPASGTIKLKGKVAGQPYERNISLNLPETDPNNDALASLWARTRIDDLSSARLKATTEANRTEIDSQITDLGLRYHLMTQFTSFVAVEDRVVNQSGTPITVQVPVNLPEGMVNGRLATVDVTTISTQTAETLPRGVNFSTVLRGDPNGKPMARSGQFKVVTKSGSGSGTGSGYGSGGAAAPGTNARGRSFQIDGADGRENTFIVDGQEVQSISGGVLNGTAIHLSNPAYPAAALAVNAGGAVNVQVVINESGGVEFARATSGHPLLRQSAEKAARSSRFSPTLISGKPVKVSGNIVYNFMGARQTTVTIDQMKVGSISSAEKRAPLPLEKMHAWIYEIVERLSKGEASPSKNESLFVHAGKADIQIELSIRSTEVLDKLRSAGFEINFEITAGKGKTTVVGRAALDKLAALAEIDEVRFILPKI